MSGITETYPTHGNAEGMETAAMIAKHDFNGLCFINLVDFDMMYGHRRDAVGYANALNKFDRWLGEFISNMKDEDALIITADHGCDPTYRSTDHTREDVPFLCYSHNEEAKDLGTIKGFDFISQTVRKILL